VRCFRREFAVSATGGSALTVSVSADSRYLLFCNGTLVCRGPAKGDINHHFYESCDLTPHLRPGRNVLAALVLDMSRVAHRPAFLGAPCSVMTYSGGFVLEGSLCAAGGPELERLDTGLPGWRVAIDQAHRFQNEGTQFEGYHGYFEQRVSSEEQAGWMLPSFDARGWEEATTLYLAERRENRRDPTSPYGLVPRMIPQLEESEVLVFEEVFAPGGGAVPAGWPELLRHGGALTLAPGEQVDLILDNGVLTTGYPQLALSEGAGAVVRLTYAEALRLPWDTPGAKLLGKRQSLANLASHFADEGTGWTFDRRGRISGWSDLWEPSGRGGAEAPERFEPLHWRAYRYVGLRITVGSEPLTLHSIGQRFSAYPYQVSGDFHCSDERLNRLWTVGLRTMRLCSHETFEDCPHYEQMQYAGDTIITSKIAMLSTGDCRLTLQALHQFDWSRLPEGLTQSRYPSRLLQVIPSWSLHWITCVRDYVDCSGDLGSVRDLLPGMRAVLDWFRRHGDEDGLPARLPFWNITDWCPWWPRGVVPGADSGPTAIISAQYILALDEVAGLARLVGRTQEVEALGAEAAGLRSAFNRRFWSASEGLYFDRPGGPELSQYGNAWAVVCGAAGPAERETMLARFPTDPKLAPGSFFCWHAVFRALEACGAYDRMPEFLGPWHEMVDGGLSTFVEENSYWRSLCHAWSAHPVIEFLTRVLGVTPRAPGYAEIDIAPRCCGLTHARGRVCSPRGPIDVAWRRSGGTFAIEITAPENTPVHVLLPGGARRSFDGGRFVETVPIP
jgi:hypothetical protein